MEIEERPPRWETEEREAFRVTFDADAEAYDRSRPVAPGEIFDDAVALAGLHPGSIVVEIGPGTGQATRPLAQRGLRIVALELGPALAERARSNVEGFPDVSVMTTSFEAWEPRDARFDAVFACNSFHWIDPEIRFRKCASVLKPGVHLIVLSTPWVVPEDADPFWFDVQDDYVAIGAARVDPSTKHPDMVDDLGPAVRRSGLFEEPTIRRTRFDVEFTAADYALNLSTQSGIKEFDPPSQAELIKRITQRIEASGGRITGHLLAMLTVARVRSAPLGERSG